MEHLDESLLHLLRIAGPPLSSSNPIARLPSLQSLLLRRNGFYAFEGALHVFPSGRDSTVTTLEDWNQLVQWRDGYGDLAPSGTAFAEDVFGCQFVLEAEGVALFDPESAQVEPLADSLAEWAGMMLEDYENLSGYPLAHEWQRTHGPLPLGHRLIPKVPFALGGAFSVSNLQCVEATLGMRQRAELAKRFAGVADGTAVSVIIEK